MEKLLRVPEAAELLNVSRSMVYSLVDRGELGCVRLGTRLLFQPDQIEAFVASRCVPAREAGAND